MGLPNGCMPSALIAFSIFSIRTSCTVFAPSVRMPFIQSQATCLDFFTQAVISFEVGVQGVGIRVNGISGFDG